MRPASKYPLKGHLPWRRPPGPHRIATPDTRQDCDDTDGYPGETVRQITSELLVIRGDDDPLVSREHAVGLADRVPGARLANLPFTGHSPHEDKAAWILSLLEAFSA